MTDGNITIIEKYLKSEFRFGEEQLKYEISRFLRNPDIGEELSYTLITRMFPVDMVEVLVDHERYTARKLMETYRVSTIYAAYSLLTQLRERPEILIHLKKGLISK